MIVTNGLTLAFFSVLAFIFKSQLLSRIRCRSQTRVREPPNAQSSVNIPFFGHLIGMMSSRIQYLSDVG
jgi:hypothetical protein